MVVIKKMSVKEFREMGGLWEVNRCFLHPRGLALKVTVDSDGNECLGEILDYRDNLESLLINEPKEATRKRFVGSAIQADGETTKTARKVPKNTSKEVFEDLFNELRKLLDDLRCLSCKFDVEQ